MKKMLVLLVVVMAALSAHAQEMYLGGGISLWRNTDLDKTSFSITPDVGYELSEQWALGIELAYAHKERKFPPMHLRWLLMPATLSMKTRSYVSFWIWDSDSLHRKPNIRMLSMVSKSE